MAWLNLPRTGPDSWQGIFVALKCMCVMALTAGNIRSTGVLYVGIMNRFGVTREEAAWPVSLAAAMLSLIGVVSGPLAQAFSPKPVILCGSLLIVIGLAASVFAPNVTWLTFTFGVIFGSGLGTVYTINVIFLQQYFVKMRGLALGLNYAGSTTAGLVFPVFITFLLGEYGFQGTVLILSGVSAHIFVLCLTHREAPWRFQKKTDESTENERSGTPRVGPASDDSEKIDHTEGRNRSKSMVLGGISPDGIEQKGDPPTSGSLSEIAESPNGNPKPPKYATSVSVELTTFPAEVPEPSDEKAKPPAEKVTLVASLSILKIPEYLVIIFSFSLFLYAYDAYFTTIIDYIVDQNVPLLKATTIVPLYSTTDMVARLVIPQLGDRGYINKMLLQCLAYGLQSACFFLMPIAAATGEFFWIATLAMIQSIGIGTSIVMYGVLMAELIGISRLPMAYGIVGLFVGMTYFTKPYFVGHFRDTLGDYSQMYVVCGILTAISSLSWLITWYVHRVTKRGRTLSNVSNTAGQIPANPQAASVSINEDTASIGRRSRADSAICHL